MAGVDTDPVSSDERVVALIHALVDRRLRLTKRDIRASVPGYDQTNDQAFARMFERDKETLRSWNFPLVTEGDGVEAVYRLDLDAWPREDVRLTPAELAVLGLAAQAWRVSEQEYAASAMATSARHATTKLAGRATGGADPVPEELTIRLRDPGPTYLPLLEAVAECRPVSFTYLAANTGDVTERHVEPWRVVEHAGAFYLVGRDVDRDAPRAFRLSRIRSAVRGQGRPGAYAIPAQDDGWFRALVRPRTALADDVRLAVLPDRGHELRARAVEVHPTDATSGPLADRDVLMLAEEDVELLADEIAGLADAVLVLAPAGLREAVRTRLRATAALGAPDGRS